MPEIAHTFGRVERSNERADASLQSGNCALRRFAQKCLEGMKHQLYWIELRRILRQVAQLCAACPDRLRHTGDFVEGDVIDHHNVLTPERGGKTLLDVSQKSFSVHGSLNQHWRHDTSWTQAGDERHRFPVSHRHIPDQTLSARVQPFRRTMLVVTAVSSINTRRAGSSNPCSRTQRRRARATSARFRSAADRLFFNSDAVASK